MTYRINAEGLAQIATFLRNNHRKGDFTISQLNAWAADAEFQLDEGNPATIEIPARHSVTGHTQTFTVSANGINFTPDETN